MNPKAIVGLVRSRVAYLKEWPEAADAMRARTDEAQPERVFDLSDVLREGMEVDTDFVTLGRHLPFPLFAVVGSGHGVIIISGDDSGFYAYCYTAPVSMVMVQFSADARNVQGLDRRAADETQVLVGGDDERVDSPARTVATVLTLIEKACNDTRHVVSYRLNRTERRNAIKGEYGGTLDNTLVHHVCLDHGARVKLTAKRGDTVVPTPKRLHEVRAHWRHLRSGIVTRVRSHTRGQRGGQILPRVYTAKLDAAMLPERAPVPAVDRSRSSPDQLQSLSPERPR